VWERDHSVPIAMSGVWRPPSDYQFPLTRFTLNRLNADGSLGAVIATSPKADYCITGDYRLAGVANTPDQTFIPQENCSNPTKPPPVSLTHPAAGDRVSGRVTLSASASSTAPATVTSVQFLLDGQPLGGPVTGPPYTYRWIVGSTPPGDHLLSARARDSDENV